MANAEARLKTKRWNDPVGPKDGHLLLVCRDRPRGARKDAETWDAWSPQLGPRRGLHSARRDAIPPHTSKAQAPARGDP
jgi:uncharacterized protein YeaO (DUF488 family)